MNPQHPMRLERPAGGKDSFGDAPPDWEPVADLWAELEPLSGRELTTAQQNGIPTVGCRIRIWYRPEVTSRMRFVMGKRIFNIDSVINEREANMTLLCMCTEVIE